MKKLILASKSKRRIDILKSLNIKFTYEDSKIKELPEGVMLPPKYITMVNALNKALNVSKKHKNGIIIGADTIIYKDGLLFGKPSSIKEAKKMLNFLKGKSHYVYSGLAIIDLYSGKTLSNYGETRVTFRSFSTKELLRYLAFEKIMDKAGSYNLDGLGSLLYSKINGCFFNVLGLPLPKLEEMLNRLNLSLFDFIEQKNT